MFNSYFRFPTFLWLVIATQGPNPWGVPTQVIHGVFLKHLNAKTARVCATWQDRSGLVVSFLSFFWLPNCSRVDHHVPLCFANFMASHCSLPKPMKRTRKLWVLRFRYHCGFMFNLRAKMDHFCKVQNRFFPTHQDWVCTQQDGGWCHKKSTVFTHPNPHLRGYFRIESSKPPFSHWLIMFWINIAINCIHLTSSNPFMPWTSWMSMFLECPPYGVHSFAMRSYLRIAVHPHLDDMSTCRFSRGQRLVNHFGHSLVISPKSMIAMGYGSKP